MATDFDNLVADLERSYEELRTRMADPAVYNDHREAADLGRRLKELEHPYKLAQEWESARDDLGGSTRRGDGLAGGDRRKRVPPKEDDVRDRMGGLSPRGKRLPLPVWRT